MKQKINFGKTYKVVIDNNGKWMHAEGSDFLFAYVKDEWDDNVKAKVADAFVSALSIPSAIKEELKKSSGESVIDGTYLSDKDQVINAINAIDNMKELYIYDGHLSGDNTAAESGIQFFKNILMKLDGDVITVKDYLIDTLSRMQARLKESEETTYFGIVVGFVYMIPILNIPTINFQYIYSTEKTKTCIIKANCSSTEKIIYDYTYTLVLYNYAPRLSTEEYHD